MARINTSCSTPGIAIFTPDESAIIERMLREYAGTIPDDQLLSEASLALRTESPANRVNHRRIG